MKTIQVKFKDSGTFALSEDNEWVCTHEDAYIEPACCSSAGSSGYIECGCGGQDAVICPSIGCTDIQDWEIDDLLDRLRGWDENDREWGWDDVA